MTLQNYFKQIEQFGSFVDVGPTLIRCTFGLPKTVYWAEEQNQPTEQYNAEEGGGEHVYHNCIARFKPKEKEEEKKRVLGS